MHTDYGADVWDAVLAAGFAAVTLSRFAEGLAITAFPSRRAAGSEAVSGALAADDDLGVFAQHAVRAVGETGDAHVERRPLGEQLVQVVAPVHRHDAAAGIHRVAVISGSLWSMRVPSGKNSQRCSIAVTWWFLTGKTQM